jgi:hypothetical protein
MLTIRLQPWKILQHKLENLACAKPLAQAKLTYVEQIKFYTFCSSKRKAACRRLED